METGAVVAMVIVAILVVAGLFILFRQIMVWYFKIEERLEAQKDANRKLDTIIDIMTQFNLKHRQDAKDATPEWVADVMEKGTVWYRDGHESDTKKGN